MEDVKVREMQIFDYKKKIAEAETKLKQQQNLYEAVRSDRNLYSKNLIESQVGFISSDKKILLVIGRYESIPFLLFEGEGNLVHPTEQRKLLHILTLTTVDDIIAM